MSTKVQHRTGSTTRTSSLRGQASILILEARFYDAISDELAAGAIAEIEAHGATWDRVAVAGALELPLALKQAVESGLIPMGAPRSRYCGAVALGCVIRGETSHFEVVCHESNHWLMEIAIRHNIPLGNGVLTVDSEAQAWARARGRDGKGGHAAAACLGLVELARTFEEQGA